MLNFNEKLKAYYQWRTRFLRTYQDGLYVAKFEWKVHDIQVSYSNEHGLSMLAAAFLVSALTLMSMEKKGIFIPSPHGGGSSSTEADVDIATALFLAKNKWTVGGNNGEIDYGMEATDLARCIWEHCFNQDAYMPLIGDWAKTDKTHYNFTKPCHFILGGYWVLQQEDAERQQEWSLVIERMIKVLEEQLALHPKTGLLADYLVLDKSEKYVPMVAEVEDKEHGDRVSNHACKTPWRLSYYYAITGDKRLKELLETQANFFMGELSHGGIHDNYSLDGDRHGNGSYGKAFTAPVRMLFGTLGWNDRYNEMDYRLNDAYEGDCCTGPTIELLCALQYSGKAKV
ncbi:Six-hairpin glycosidase-like protein [Chlamydoabsidia padenii]|nr:Six-hairpin glycosidase-like protein [Chlamydoabsidia padenii]